MLKDTVLRTIGVKNIVVVAIIQNRFCNMGKNLYLCWDELSNKTMLMSTEQLYAMRKNIRNVCSEMVKGHCEVFFTWCAKDKVPIVTAINDSNKSFKIVQDGIWLLRRYRCKDIDRFDTVNALGEFKCITADEVLRLRYSMHISNATIIMKHNLIRGTLQSIPIIEEENKRKELQEGFNNMLKGVKSVAFVIRSYNNDKEKHFRMKVTARDFNIDGLNSLLKGGTYEYVQDVSGLPTIVIGVDNNFELFLRYVKVILSNVKVHNMAINCIVAKNDTLGCDYKLRNKLRMLLSENGRLTRDISVDGSVISANRDTKEVFSRFTSDYYIELIKALRSVRVIDSFSKKGLIKEYELCINGLPKRATLKDAKEIVERCITYTGKDIEEADSDAIFKCLSLSGKEYTLLNKINCLNDLVTEYGISFVTVKCNARPTAPLNFMHVTRLDNVDLIMKEGIKVNKGYVSDLGIGNYVVWVDDCIGKDNLRNYIADMYENELYDDYTGSITELAIVQGEYVGDFYKCVLGEGHEGYILISEDIPAKCLDKDYTVISVR